MRVLVADDDLVSRRILEANLKRWGYEVVVASDGAEAWELLQRKDAPRLAILDWIMPTMDGIEVCRRIRQLGQEPYTYMLLLTGKDGKENVIEGMGAGADDYLTKPFNAMELKVRLNAGRRILDLEAQLIATREALREQATHDSLTLLWNRQAILDILDRELSRTRRQGGCVGVVMADIDHFKLINDHYGHSTGDEVLRESARRFLSVLRAYDSVGRVGGEEFLIVLPGSNAESAMSQAERLRLRMSDTPILLAGQNLAVTVSLGVHSSADVEDFDPDGIIREADTALYDAKNSGRNCVRRAAAVRPSKTPAAMEMESLRPPGDAR